MTRLRTVSGTCWLVGILLALPFGVSFGGPPSGAKFPPPESQGGWPKLESAAEIRSAGMDPARLAELRQWLLASDERDFAAVVIKNGQIVLEVERGNSSRTDARRVASVSKAVCATVLAIAAEESQQGRLPRRMSFDDRAFDFLPWAQPLSDPRKAQITVKQLLNHTSGICPEATGAKNDGTWQYVLGHTGDPSTAQLAFDPGTACGYSTHALAHAALVCETVSGMPYDQFAIERLFRPVGCEQWWFQQYEGDEQHGSHPSHGLGMPARDLARLAYCLLRGGRWEERQVIPTWFVNETSAPTHDVRTLELRFGRDAASFSHGWELPARLTLPGKQGGLGIPADARFKPGSGGQLIAFVPSLDLVVTRQTGLSGPWEYAEFLRLACQAVLPQAARELDEDKIVEIATAELRAGNTPGAAIGVVRDGKLIFSKGLGLASVETGQPVAPEMLFRLGSTTKMFTAAALVELAERGELALHSPIGSCVAGLDPAIAAVTPHQLLTHTAGLQDAAPMSGLHDDSALAAQVRRIDATWLFTTPGSIYSYSNPGYWIAGLASEEVLTKPYADALRSQLFQPLGMDRTTLRPLLAMSWPLALGHEVRAGAARIVRPQANNAATSPAGQIFSSVPELARFATAMMDQGKLDGRQVLDPHVVDLLTRPYVVRPGTASHYGYGLAILTDRGVRLWEHSGSRSGYGSVIRMAPDHKLGVIILTNRTGMSLPKTMAAICEMLLPFDSLSSDSLSPDSLSPDPRTQPENWSEQDLAELVGTYVNGRQTVEIVSQAGKLHLRRRGETATGGGVVTPASKQRLSVRSAAATEPASSYSIVRGASGRIDYLMSSGRAFRRAE